MVENAIDAHPALVGVRRTIYAKGSYANNTNVRLDSDVDIVVECHECNYYDFADGIQAPPGTMSAYTGKWTPGLWRAEVVGALVGYFGALEVDASGEIAIRIKEKPGSRPSTDVVPSFDYRRYLSADQLRQERGSMVHTRQLSRIINWPDQQLVNGQAKNTRTGRRYKNFVRALKNGENYAVERGLLVAKPSYFMECLVYNARDETLQSGDLSQGFQSTLQELWSGLKGPGHESWVEPNELKYLFHSTQNWTVEDARDVVLQTWNYLFS